MGHARAVPGLLVAIALVALLAAVWGGGGRTLAQEPPPGLPTPRGQLGGPAPLVPGGNIPAPAQEDTTATPDVPAPEECQIEPRTVDEVLELIAAAGTAASPEAGPPTAVATPPAGEPVSDDVAEAVERTAREFIACGNAGDFLRLLALLSDAYVPRFLADAGLTDPADVPLLDRDPRPLPPEARTELIEVREVRRLPDDRVAATVEGDDPTSEAPARSPTLIFVEVGDRWLIDQVIEDEDEDDLVGTPAP